MNAVEIEEAISTLAQEPFNSVEFPYSFLEAFGNKETTLKRLRSSATNKSDVGGLLQTNNIHIAVAPPGAVTKVLAALKASPATTRAPPMGKTSRPRIASLVRPLYAPTAEAAASQHLRHHALIIRAE